MKRYLTNKEVSILITGDFCPMYKLQEDIVKGNLNYIYGDFFKIIKEADISILNLESPITLNQYENQRVRSDVARRVKGTISLRVFDDNRRQAVNMFRWFRVRSLE